MKTVKVLNDLMLNGQVILKKDEIHPVLGMANGEGWIFLPGMVVDNMQYAAAPEDVQWLQCDNVIHVDFINKKRVIKCNIINSK